MTRLRGKRVHPFSDRRLVVPPDAIPPPHAEATGYSNQSAGMALNDRCPECSDQHNKIPFRPSRTIKNDPLVLSAPTTKEPAGETVGEAPSGVKGLVPERTAGDVQVRTRGPGIRRLRWLQNRSRARDAPLMNRRVKGLVDLLEKDVLGQACRIQEEPVLLQVLGQASSPAVIERHRGHATGAAALSLLVRSSAFSPCPGRSSSAIREGCRSSVAGQTESLVLTSLCSEAY